MPLGKEAGPEAGALVLVQGRTLTFGPKGVIDVSISFPKYLYVCLISSFLRNLTIYL